MFRSLCKLRIGIGAAALCLTVASAVHASQADWHLQLAPAGTNYGSGMFADWVPFGGPNPNNSIAASSGSVNGIDYTIWDGYGPHGNSTTGKYHDCRDFGGQQFDAKAMFMRNDDKNVYVGIVTGFNPAGVVNPYDSNSKLTMGDLALNPNWSHASSQFAVLAPSSLPGSSGSAQLVGGGTWTIPDQSRGFGPTPYVKYQSGGTSLASDVLYTYTDLGLTYQDPTTHNSTDVYLLEFTIPRIDLGDAGSGPLTASWGMSCNNDSITVSHTVPEPSSAMALGGLAFIMLGRRPRRKRAA